MSCHPPVYQSALPHGADSHTAGVAREMNKSTEVSPIPQGASEYSQGSHMGKIEIKVATDPPTSTGQCEWMSWLQLIHQACEHG